MSSFLSRIHADLRRARLTRRGATHRPENVPQGIHKIYQRMPYIALPEPEPLLASLPDALARRRSARGGDPRVPLTLREVGTLLGLSLRKRGNSLSRPYPSGGALYPIETYLLSAALESQPPAAFHYDPTNHTLARLWELPASFDIKTLAKHPDGLHLSSLLVFTSVWQRSSAKYGDLAYQHALLEAGHMSENILLVGCALDLQVRPYAGFSDTLIAQHLDLDEEREQTVHTITICKGEAKEDAILIEE